MKRGLTFAVVSMLLIISGRLCHASTDYVVLSLDISTDIVSRAGTVMEEYVTMANEYIQGKIGSVGDINAVKKQKDKVDRLKKRTEKLQKMQKKAKAIADKAKEKKAALQARADRMKEMEKYRAAQEKYQKVQDKINEAQTKINDVKDKVQSKVNAVQSEIDKAKGYVDQAKDYANQARTYVQEGIETVGELKDTAQNYANRVKQTATGYVDQTSGYVNDAQQVLGNSVPNSEVSMQEPAFEQTFPTDVVAAQEEYNTAVQYEMPVAQPEVADDLSEQMTAAGVSAQEGLELMGGANPEMASQTGEALVQKGTISIQQKADALLAIKDMAMSDKNCFAGGRNTGDFVRHFDRQGHAKSSNADYGAETAGKCDGDKK